MMRDERGAVLVEAVMALAPVLLFFGATLQFADAAVASLIVQRAASAAVRAAIVVLPDDPAFYQGEPVNYYGGNRRAAIETAAKLVIESKASLTQRSIGDEPRLADRYVRVDGSFSGNGTMTVEVFASYLCFPGFLGVGCGLDGVLTMTAVAQLPYQGADFPYVSHGESAPQLATGGGGVGAGGGGGGAGSW